MFDCSRNPVVLFWLFTHSSGAGLTTHSSGAGLTTHSSGAGLTTHSSGADLTVYTLQWCWYDCLHTPVVLV